MGRNILLLTILILCISFASANLPTCTSDNKQDISKIPCLGLTTIVFCNENVSVLNINTSEQTNLSTTQIGDGRLNFTFNFNTSTYSLVDCQNNTATVVVGRFEQGFGTNIFTTMFPAAILSFITLFITGRMFKKFKEEDDEHHEELINNHDEESFLPKSRLRPIIFMLFSFIPMIFMVGFVDGHLIAFMPDANLTSFYGMYYVMFTYVFYGIVLISFIVWLSSYITKRKVSRGIIDGVE